MRHLEASRSYVKGWATLPGTGTQGQLVGQLTVSGPGGAGGAGHSVSPTKTTVDPICK